VKEIAKISGKRKKTDSDLNEIARLEWYGGLYTNKDKPCINAESLEAAMVEAAKRFKLGKATKVCVYCLDNYPLQFPDQDKSLEWLWESGKYVSRLRVQLSRGSSLIRTRPRFDEWAADITIRFDDERINPAQIRDILVAAGDSVGIGDFRPKFGRFEVV
jgi:hypothetical protein